MKSFLDFTLRRLVSHPDYVAIGEIHEEKALMYRIAVHPEDVGKVVGRHGRTIGAIRSLIKAALPRDHKHVLVEIVEALPTT